jgi:hypothetical protein
MVPNEAIQMTRKLIQPRHTGRGRLCRGTTELGAVEYELEVWQDFNITDAGGERQELPGLKDLQIRFIVLPISPQELSGTLTLVLRDGTRVEGFLKDRRFVPGNA